MWGVPERQYHGIASNMAVDRATVAHIAALARIRLSEAELEPLATELSRILDWVEQLNELDTSAVAPMASVAASGLPMREDRVTDGNCREAILASAPKSATGGGEAGFFAVPKVIE
jgi:aspartyl-tRNA(Asn)/glutamyl-tRNA(Gln) amidotransferase subunit C